MRGKYAWVSIYVALERVSPAGRTQIYDRGVEGKVLNSQILLELRWQTQFDPTVGRSETVLVSHTSEYFSEFSEFSIFCTHHLGKGTLGQKGREMGQTAILFCLCLVIGQVSLATIIMGVIFVCIKFRDSTKNHFHMMKHTFAFFTWEWPFYQPQNEEICFWDILVFPP